MPQFRFKADVVFHATSREDALHRVARHCEAMASARLGDSTAVVVGTLGVKKVPVVRLKRKP